MLLIEMLERKGYKGRWAYCACCGEKIGREMKNDTGDTHWFGDCPETDEDGDELCKWCAS